MKDQQFTSLKCNMFLISPRNQVVLIQLYFSFLFSLVKRCLFFPLLSFDIKFLKLACQVPIVPLQIAIFTCVQVQLPLPAKKCLEGQNKAKDKEKNKLRSYTFLSLSLSLEFFSTSNLVQELTFKFDCKQIWAWSTSGSFLCT